MCCLRLDVEGADMAGRGILIGGEGFTEPAHLRFDVWGPRKEKQSLADSVFPSLVDRPFFLRSWQGSCLRQSPSAGEHRSTPPGVCTGPAHSCDSRTTLVPGLSPRTWALSSPWVPTSGRARDSRCSINTRIKGSCFLSPPASCFSIDSPNTISGSTRSQDLRFPRC